MLVVVFVVSTFVLFVVIFFLPIKQLSVFVLLNCRMLHFYAYFIAVIGVFFCSCCLFLLSLLLLLSCQWC